jgi:hypothetical protein
MQFSENSLSEKELSWLGGPGGAESSVSVMTIVTALFARTVAARQLGYSMSFVTSFER